MKGLSFARRLALVAVGVSLSGALHVVSLNTCAAQGPNAHDAQDFSLQASGSPLSELTTLAGILSERYGAKVVVDPAIAVTARPLVLGPKLPMETALDILTRPMRNVAWRRIYLAQHTKQPEPATLAAWVRALTGVEQHGLWCEDASAKRALTYTREGNGSPLIGQELEAGAWD